MQRTAWVSLFIAAATVPAQEPLVPRAELRGLERVATDLARGGHAEPWRDVVAVLGRLGLPEKDLAALRTAGDKELAKRKKPAAADARASRSLRDEANKLALRLPQVPPGESTREFARQLLALDAEVEAANTVLGHEKVGATWYLAGEAVRAERWRKLQKALQDARALPVKLDVGEVAADAAPDATAAVGGAMLPALLGRPFTRLRAGNIVVDSQRSVAETRRIVEQALRALAVVNFVTKGDLTFPEHPRVRLVMLDSKADYDRSITLAVQRGWLDANGATNASKLSGYYLANGDLVDIAALESDAASALLVLLAGERFEEPALTAGVLNWVTRACFGASIPSYAWLDKAKAAPVKSERTTSQQRAAQELREAMLRLAEAGLAGSRRYLRYLAQQREDPPWSAAMLEDIGRIEAEALLKATFVAEYLFVDGALARLLDGLRRNRSGDRPERFAKALGEPLAEFEARWCEWLIGLSPGVVQRLGAGSAEVPRDVASTLSALVALRERAFSAASASVTPGVVVADPELGAGCVLHASYLVAHPEHAAAWPDAHEENADHGEWSAAGAWAGAHSVIAPGVKDGEAALEAWMGTFFHRVPLLDPGLVRIGFGMSGDVAVLDCGSMVAPRAESWHVAWPPAGATGVPTRFVAELPNPVPGEDQARFGHPITLQFGRREGATIVQMRLCEGAKDGREIACWYSTPQAPLNPECAPKDCFCLIPKAPLRGGTTYTVVARLPQEAVEIVWSFKTQ